MNDLSFDLFQIQNGNTSQILTSNLLKKYNSVLLSYGETNGELLYDYVPKKTDLKLIGRDQKPGKLLFDYKPLAIDKTSTLNRSNKNLIGYNELPEEAIINTSTLSPDNKSLISY